MKADALIAFGSVELIKAKPILLARNNFFCKKENFELLCKADKAFISINF